MSRCITNVTYQRPGTSAFEDHRPVRLAYQPPASGTFLSEQTSHQYFSLRTNQHQPLATNQTNRLHNWMGDHNLPEGLTAELLAQFVTLWNLVATTILRSEQEDKIICTRTPHRQYTTSSAYKAQLSYCATVPEIASIWKAPPHHPTPNDASSRHGSFFRPECGPAIDSTAEVGTTAPLVPSAGKLWKLRITYLQIVDTRAGSGTRLATGSGYLTYKRPIGHLPRLHSNGGSSSPRDKTFPVKLHAPLRFSSIGKFGRREINCQVFNRTESPVRTLVIKIKEKFSLWLSAGAKGAFARVAVTSLACPRGPGHTWPVSSGAIHHVCLPVLCGPGQNEFVFVQHHPAGPKHQSTG
jgi:hypothetical protein